jgi:aspartate-semialdehyde dehydrogenase
MNDCAFYQCKYFLEQRISEQPENVELVKAYIFLIKQKTKFDIAFFSQNADVQKNWNNNLAEINKQWQQSQ